VAVSIFVAGTGQHSGKTLVSLRLVAALTRCGYQVHYMKPVGQRVADGEVFKRTEPIKWKCGNCGYVHEGTEAPEVCRACQHPQAYYEPWAGNY